MKIRLKKRVSVLSEFELRKEGHVYDNQLGPHMLRNLETLYACGIHGLRRRATCYRTWDREFTAAVNMYFFGPYITWKGTMRVKFSPILKA